MVESVIYKMIDYFGDDAKRINHALKVYGFASCIARSEKLSASQIMVVDIAAILHDIGIKEAERKYNSSGGKYQEIEGPAIAMELLRDEGLEKGIVDRILYIIGHHHTYNMVDGTDFQILVEADFLVNIFEDGMSAHSIESIRTKHFKTNTGISLINRIYPEKQ